MFILAAIILVVLNANAVAMPSWLLITAIVLGALELGFYVLAIIINVLAFVGIKRGMRDIRKRDR
jgi:hypothetical protein